MNKVEVERRIVPGLSAVAGRVDWGARGGVDGKIGDTEFHKAAGSY